MTNFSGNSSSPVIQSKLVLQRLPRPGGKPGIFRLQTIFFSQMLCLRPLGYCAPFFFVDEMSRRPKVLAKGESNKLSFRKKNVFLFVWKVNFGAATKLFLSRKCGNLNDERKYLVTFFPSCSNLFWRWPVRGFALSWRLLQSFKINFSRLLAAKGCRCEPWRPTL